MTQVSGELETNPPQDDHILSSKGASAWFKSKLEDKETAVTHDHFRGGNRRRDMPTPRMVVDVDPVTAGDDGPINRSEFATSTPGVTQRLDDLESEAVQVLKLMIVAVAEREYKELSVQLDGESREPVLARIIRNRSHLINVRAHAARQLFTRAAGVSFFDEFRTHPSKLIRLGLMLGLGDREDVERLRHFVHDEDAAIAEEAAEMLEDVGSE